MRFAEMTAPEIREIREEIGVPPAEVSNNPSYNEIMQAMTKERFMAPDYFIRSKDDSSNIRQEQGMIDGYITLVQQDVLDMQEQINALLRWIRLCETERCERGRSRQCGHNPC